MTELKLSRWIRMTTLAVGVTFLAGCATTQTGLDETADSATATEVATEKYTWDLTDLYSSDAAWDAAYAETESQIASLASYQGTLGKSAQSMATAMRAISDAYKEVLRIYVYTSLKRDEDQRVPETQVMFGKSMALYQKLGESISWVDPEILAVGEKTVLKYLKQNLDLAPFEFHLKDTLRQAEHTLDAKGEALLAQAGMSMAQPEETYSLYANASIHRFHRSARYPRRYRTLSCGHPGSAASGTGCSPPESASPLCHQTEWWLAME